MQMFSWKSIPGWISIAVWFCWEFLGAWARIEFVFKKMWPEKSMTPILSAIASSRWFPSAILIVGLVWIYWVSRPSKQQQVEEKRAINSNAEEGKDAQIINQVPLIKQSSLIIRSLMISQPYSIGTIFGGIEWTPDLRDLRIIFDNPTDKDYQELDITIRPDFPNITIVAIGQVSNIPNVTFPNPVMQAYLRPDGKPEVKFDKKTGHILGDGWKFTTEEQRQGLVPLRAFPNHYRIRCEKLPHHMVLEITLAIAKEDIAKQEGKISNVWAKGQYYEGSNIHSIDQTISVSN